MNQSLTDTACFKGPVHSVTIHPFGVLQVKQQLVLVHAGHHPASVLSKSSRENSSSPPASRKALLNLLR